MITNAPRSVKMVPVRDCGKDDGFRDQNLLPNRLDKRATLLPGGPTLPHGLNESFRGVMLTRFHAMEGAEDAVLPHTWSSSLK